MEVQVAETGPCSRTLTITVPSALVDEHLDGMYASASQQVRLKGFRPGHVPRELIQKRFGAGILSEAKEQMLNRFFGEACRSKELAPVGRVAIDDVDKLEVKPGTALQFTAKIDVRPVFQLEGSKGIAVEPFEAEATEADVDNAIQEIAHQKRTIQPADDAAQDGDFVKGDLSFLDEQGQVVHERKGVQLNTRVPVHGCDEAAWTAAVVGARAGQTLSVPLVFPPAFEKPAVRGKPGTASIAVSEVLRVQAPPIDDEFAKGVEFESLDALREDLRRRISQEKQRLGRQRQEEQCLQHLLASNAIPVPPSLVDEQQRASLAAFQRRLEEAGTPKEEIEKKLEESRAEAHQEAERRVRLFFLIEAVARQHKLFVTENDVDTEVRAIAQANDATPAQVREHLEQHNQLGELRLALLERKVREFLRDNANTVDKTGGSSP